MKICLINNLFYTGHYVEFITTALSRENEVVVISTKPFSGSSSLSPSVDSEGWVRVYRFYPGNVYSQYPPKHRPFLIKPLWYLIDIWNPHSYIVIKNIIKMEKPDIVHTINLTGLSTSVFGAVKAYGCPHIHTLTDGALISPWTVLLRNGRMINFNFFDKQYIKIRRFLSKSANVVLGISRFMLDIHLSNGYFKNSLCDVIDYPYRLQPSVLKPKTYDPFDILFVGNVSQSKGIFVLLDAFRKLNRSGVNLHFVGRGADLESLKRKAQGLSNVYIHGFVSDEDLAEIYSRANITVAPSLSHEAGPPSAFLDSLPCGTPVIGSNRGAIPEGIIDGVNGRLFEAGDSSALRDILQDLIDNQDRLKKMEVEALKSADKYRPEEYIANLLKVYKGARHG